MREFTAIPETGSAESWRQSGARWTPFAVGMNKGSELLVEECQAGPSAIVPWDIYLKALGNPDEVLGNPMREQDPEDAALDQLERSRYLSRHAEQRRNS